MPMIKCAIPVDIAEKVVEDIRSKMKESAQMIKVDTVYYKFPLND